MTYLSVQAMIFVETKAFTRQVISLLSDEDYRLNARTPEPHNRIPGQSSKGPAVSEN